ncbi:acyl-CoA dehydrogenase family protein [Rhodococcus koreensis]|uniref:acyl-CoA dehydrogenase family protein n=1 Tax=Rhodococcus koreensis TaxID=99653 RepID=UPI003B84B0E7
MSWCVSTASEYAKTRVQFGRPIGQFQGVEHKCAHMGIAGHVDAGRDRRAAARDDRVGPVQRGLPRRRVHPLRERGQEHERRLERGAHDAGRRAGGAEPEDGGLCATPGGRATRRWSC